MQFAITRYSLPIIIIIITISAATVSTIQPH